MTRVHLTDPEQVLHVTTDARDRRAAEFLLPAVVKSKPGTPLKVIIEAYPETWTAWTHWHAATRVGAVECTWDQWSTRLLNIDPDPDDGDGGGAALPDPTGPAT